jgi:hypothetical protein
MRIRSNLPRALAALLALTAGHARADQIIGAGGSVSLGQASVSLGCTDLYVAGTLDFEQGEYRDVRQVFVQPGGTINGNDGRLFVSAPVNVAPGGNFNPQQLSVQPAAACGGAISTGQLQVIPATGTAALFALACVLALFAAFVLRNQFKGTRR